MKRFALIGILVALTAVAMVGCNWDTGSDAETWSDVYNWVNYSGTYLGSFSNMQVVAEAGIQSFTVTQQGQNLQILDNRGGAYEGNIRAIRSISGSGPAISNTNSMVMPKDGDRVVASYECSGTSASRRSTQMVGTLEGIITGGVFNNRRIFGTWIEAGGRSGTIAGEAIAVQITTVTVTNAP